MSPQLQAYHIKVDMIQATLLATSRSILNLLMRSDSPELHVHNSHTMHWDSITEHNEKPQPTSIFQSTCYKINQAAPGTQGHTGPTYSQRHLEFITVLEGSSNCVATTQIPQPGAPPQLHSLVLNQEASIPSFQREEPCPKA